MRALPLRAVHRRLRRGWAHAQYRVGALDRRLDAKLRTSAVVLTYHRVLADPDRRRSWSHPGMIVSLDTFARHVRALRQHFTVVDVREFIDATTQGRALPPRACLVTFDDGWLDTWACAAPILAEHRVPATVFLTTQFVGCQVGFWQERLGRALDAAAGARATVRDEARVRLARYGADAVFAGEPTRWRIVQTIRQLKRTPHGELLKLVADLEALAEVRPDPTSPDQFLTWDQAQGLLGAGFTIGAHGATHRLLDMLSDAEITAEVEESKQTITTRLGHCERAFCYPNGSWSPAAVAAVEAAGFDVAFTTDEGVVDRGTLPFRVPRVNMHDAMTDTVPTWLARILQVNDR